MGHPAIDSSKISSDGLFYTFKGNDYSHLYVARSYEYGFLIEFSDLFKTEDFKNEMVVCDASELWHSGSRSKTFEKILSFYTSAAPVMCGRHSFTYYINTGTEAFLIKCTLQPVISFDTLLTSFNKIHRLILDRIANDNFYQYVDLIDAYLTEKYKSKYVREGVELVEITHDTLKILNRYENADLFTISHDYKVLIIRDRIYDLDYSWESYRHKIILKNVATDGCDTLSSPQFCYIKAEIFTDTGYVYYLKYNEENSAFCKKKPGQNEKVIKKYESPDKLVGFLYNSNKDKFVLDIIDTDNIEAGETHITISP